MKYKIKYFALIVIVTLSVKTSFAHNYSEENVIKNVSTFIEKLFGENPPSLSTYYYYEGHTEAEEIYEYFECRIRWGGMNSQACRDWLQLRSKNPEREPSVYYSAIRNRFHINFSDIHLIKIVPPSKAVSGEFYRIITEVQGQNLTLEFIHAFDKDTSDIRFIGLDRINNLPVSKILAVPCIGVVDLSNMHELCIEFYKM